MACGGCLRRPCLEDLVQIDGSEHTWFEDRGPRCSLTVFIDDATGRLLALRFATAETTEACMGVLLGYRTGTAARWRCTRTGTASSG